MFPRRRSVVGVTRSVLALAALLSWVLLVAARPVGAHAEVREADPAPGGVAPAGIEEITITFLAMDPTGPVIVDVHGPDGEELVTGDAEVSARDSVVTVPVTALKVGEHSVEWSVLSDDGDGQSRGEYTFTVEPAPDSGVGLWLIWLVALAVPAFVFLRPGARKRKDAS